MVIKKEFCFLNREETNSWNRIKRAPGMRWADKKDEDRVEFILQACEKKGIVKMRSLDGVKLWGSEE